VKKRLSPHFSLYLFSTNSDEVQRADAAGVDGFVIDWEHIGKAERQAGYDTQINHDTLNDLRRVRACTRAPVICRVNPVGPWTEREVGEAVDAGATELLLPMVRTAAEVERVLQLVGGSCGVGILIETVDAVGAAADLARLPLTRVYVGMQDLAIERRVSNPFQAVADGTVASLRRLFSIPFGFAGLTLPEGGFPIPCRLLLAEMARLQCGFTFLRRSFHRDTAGQDLTSVVARLRAAIVQMFQLSGAALEEEHQLLLGAIMEAERFFDSRNGPHA
jgi:hypothetical protein